MPLILWPLVRTSLVLLCIREISTNKYKIQQQLKGCSFPRKNDLTLSYLRIFNRLWKTFLKVHHVCLVSTIYYNICIDHVIKEVSSEYNKFNFQKNQSISNYLGLFITVLGYKNVRSESKVPFSNLIYSTMTVSF